MPSHNHTQKETKNRQSIKPRRYTYQEKLTKIDPVGNRVFLHRSALFFYLLEITTTGDDDSFRCFHSWITERFFPFLMSAHSSTLVLHFLSEVFFSSSQTSQKHIPLTAKKNARFSTFNFHFQSVGRSVHSKHFQTNSQLQLQQQQKRSIDWKED